jgi:hypothetical protein
MADYHFAQTNSWQELLSVHEKWVADYNYQVHWAHRQPAQSGRDFGLARGKLRDADEIERIFHAMRYNRQFGANGYVRFRYWQVYGELGLVKKKAAVWLYKESLTIEARELPVAQYSVEYQPDG